MNALPLEVMGEIPSYLPPTQLPILRSVCKLFRSATHFHIIHCILRYVNLEVTFHPRLKPETFRRILHDWIGPKLAAVCPLSKEKKLQVITRLLQQYDYPYGVHFTLRDDGPEFSYAYLDHYFATKRTDRPVGVFWTDYYPEVPNIIWWEDWVRSERDGDCLHWVLHPALEGEQVTFSCKEGVEPFFPGVKGLDINVALSVDPFKRWYSAAYQPCSKHKLERRLPVTYARMRICSDQEDDVGFPDIVDLAEGDVDEDPEEYERDIVGTASEAVGNDGDISWMEWFEKEIGRDTEVGGSNADNSSDDGNYASSDTSSEAEEEYEEDEKSDLDDWLFSILQQSP
ncbi:hypothetical protein HDV00_008145 [Rhizophlyctis rosea]|nr:hypothetical protein HDV00_008145 [Rhizophlyctis rosea]